MFKALIVLMFFMLALVTFKGNHEGPKGPEGPRGDGPGVQQEVCIPTKEQPCPRK